MEPFEIRTVPARLPMLQVALGIVYVGLLGYLVWTTLTITSAVVRKVADEPADSGLSVLLLAVILGLLWLFTRMCAPTIQVVGLYLFRDRGKQVVAHRLDASGWHHVVAGTDVTIPWAGMAAAITERTDERYHLLLTSHGPFTASRDPFSRQVRRTLRKDGGLVIPMTHTHPTEDELAGAIEAQSRGQVRLGR